MVRWFMRMPPPTLPDALEWPGFDRECCLCIRPPTPTNPSSLPGQKPARGFGVSISSSIHLTFSPITPAQIAEWADAECLDSDLFRLQHQSRAPGLPSATCENATLSTSKVTSSVCFVPYLSLETNRSGSFSPIRLDKTSERPVQWKFGWATALYPATDGTLANVMRSIDPSVYQIVTADDFVQLWRQAEGLPQRPVFAGRRDAGPATDSDVAC